MPLRVSYGSRFGVRKGISEMDDADCGINPVTGDKMGHNHRGLCMHPGCYKVVDHGLSHACGGDHGGGDIGCGKYFCYDHLYWNLCRKCLHEMTKDPVEEDDTPSESQCP